MEMEIEDKNETIETDSKPEVVGELNSSVNDDITESEPENDSEKVDDDLTTETATEGSTTSESSPKKVNTQSENVETSDKVIDNKTEKRRNVNNDSELRLKCIDCSITQCVMWRKHSQSNVLCNICHLKRVKNTAQPSGNALNSKLISTLVNQNNRAKEQMPRLSKRKSKTNKKFANGLYSDRLIKNGNSKNRRNLYKRKPSKAAEGISAIVQTQSVYHNGLLYEVGDIVCTNDIDGGVYFAQVRGFFQDEFCEKSAVITWLIPTLPNLTQFDPMRFLPGLDEDTPRPMECFDFVCRAPSNLFKSKLSHCPYQRSQASLDNLLYAANVVDNNDVIVEKEEDNTVQLANETEDKPLNT